MGAKPSACLDHHGEPDGEAEPSGLVSEKSGSTSRLRRRGGSRGGGSYHGHLKVEQFSGIATIQLTSVLPLLSPHSWLAFLDV